jgi:signal transduction histidine kinase
MKNLFGRLKQSAYTFPLAVVTALTLMVISESAYHASVDSLDRVGELTAARNDNLQLLRQVLDAENGQRGYLITGRPEYLQPYRAAMQGIGSTMKKLGEFYSKEPSQTANFTVLASLVGKKLSEMDTTVRLRSEGREEAWRAVIETDIGREQMETIRIASERLIEHGSTMIEGERREVYKTLLLSRLGVSAMTALSVLAFFMYLRQSSTLEKERLERQQAMQAQLDLLEQQVAARTAQLTELAQHLQNAREDERSRLARDLHDELGALLTAAKLDVARLKSRIGPLTPEVTERLTHLTETLNNGIALKRRIIEDLRPSSLNNLGLVAALEILTREFGESSGIDVQGDFAEGVRLAPASELTVYRLVQEALTNIGKYAQAKQVRIVLRGRGSQAEVSVEDDGVGFDVDARQSSSHGLLGMRYRVEAARGRMHLQSTPGKGTKIRASLPMLAAQPEATADAT